MEPCEQGCEAVHVTPILRASWDAGVLLGTGRIRYFASSVRAISLTVRTCTVINMASGSFRIDPAVKVDTVLLVSNLSGEIAEGCPEWVCAVDAVTCLWNLSINPVKHQSIFDAGAVPLVIASLTKGSPGARPEQLRLLF